MPRTNFLFFNFAPGATHPLSHMKQARKLKVTRPDAPDLPVDLVHDVLRRGELARESTTQFDPPSRGGYEAYADRVRAIRELLVPRGWDWNDDKNLSVVVSPCGRHAILIVTGDSFTGLISHTPQPKYPRGDATMFAVIPNAQLDLFSKADVVGTDQPYLWILLVHRDDVAREVRSELSFPEAITDDGYVTKWGFRLIYPALSLEPRSLGTEQLRRLVPEPVSALVEVRGKG
jgi:hypothetical protein